MSFVNQTPSVVCLGVLSSLLFLSLPWGFLPITPYLNRNDVLILTFESTMPRQIGMEEMLIS